MNFPAFTFDIAFLFKIFFLFLIGVYAVFVFIVFINIRSLRKLVLVERAPGSTFITALTFFYLILTISLFVLALVIL